MYCLLLRLRVRPVWWILPVFKVSIIVEISQVWRIQFHRTAESIGLSNVAIRTTQAFDADEMHHQTLFLIYQLRE